MKKKLPLGWKLTRRGRAIQKTFRLKNFKEAVQLIRRILPIAESMDHHPDLHLTRYRRLRILIYTHTLNALSSKDFILASKIEKLPKKLEIGLS